MTIARLLTAAVIASTSFASFSVAQEVAFIAILNVPEENAQEFDALAKDMVAASAKDEGQLVYEFARDGTTVYGYERYVDAAAHTRHEALIEPFLPKLMTLARFEKIVTLSQLPDSHRDVFKEIGAVIGDPIAGVAQDRPN